MSRVLITLCTQTNDVNELNFGIVDWVLHHSVLVFITVISSYQNSVTQRQLISYFFEGVNIFVTHYYHSKATSLPLTFCRIERVALQLIEQLVVACTKSIATVLPCSMHSAQKHLDLCNLLEVV